MLEIGAAGGEHARSKWFIHSAPKSRTDDDMTELHGSILEECAAEAIRLGAEQLEVEYKDGYEELSAIAGDFGFGIGSLRSTSQAAACLVAGWLVLGAWTATQTAESGGHGLRN
jgi:hypothetical protein